MSTCRHRATCCTCVWYLTGFGAKRACSPTSASSCIGRGSVLSVMPWHLVPPRDLSHVTDCVEAPLARSWPNLVFCIAFPDSGVKAHSRVVPRVRGVGASNDQRRHQNCCFRSGIHGNGYRWSVSCRRNRRDNPVSKVSATLSPECQEPCYPCLRGAARRPVLLALQRFAERR